MKTTINTTVPQLPDDLRKHGISPTARITVTVEVVEDAAAQVISYADLLAIPRDGDSCYTSVEDIDAQIHKLRDEWHN